MEIGGQLWLIGKPGSLEDAWESLDGIALADERLPYWMEIWPSAIALARWLYARTEDIAGRICLDLGCGLGFSAIVGQFLGGVVWAADYDTRALECTLANSIRNGVNLHGLLAMDWRAPALAEASIDRIWASDIIYEKRFIGPQIRLFDGVLAEDGKIWIADPDRNIFPLFMEELCGAGFGCELVEVFVVEQESAGNVHVNIWEICRR